MGSGAAGDRRRGGQDVSGRHTGHVHQVGGHRQRDVHVGSVERGQRQSGAQLHPLDGCPNGQRQDGRGREMADRAFVCRAVRRGRLPVWHTGRVADVEADRRRYVPNGRDECVVHWAAGPDHAVLGRGRHAVPRFEGQRLASAPPVRQALVRCYRCWPPVRAVHTRDNGPS